MAASKRAEFKVSRWLPPQGMRVIIILAIVLGIFFRWVNLDKQLYWYDEVLTTLRISGYLQPQFSQEVSEKNLVSVEELQQYQRLSPDKSLIDTFKALAGNAEHPPLYYLMARFWAQLFGTSISAMRSLPASISLLVFPCIYWLCWELFQSRTVGWIAVALTSVSPICIFYAQEARQYSLWSVIILLSSTTLLRAIRLKTQRSWALYAASIILALYTHLLSLLWVIAQGIYVLAVERFRLTETLKAYFWTSVCILAA